MHEETVEELHLGIDRVDVGHQAGSGLRLAGGEDLRRCQAHERILVGRQLQQCTHLREDVEGPGVAGMYQVPVALRRQQLEVDALDEPSPVDADLLRRDADPGVTRGGQVTMEEPPVGSGVDAGRHVVPLDHDRPTEAQWILRPARHEPGPERSLGTGGHVPVAVGTAFALQFVGPGRSFEAVLDLLVAERGQVVVPHDVRRRARHFLEHSLSCAGHGKPPWIDAAGGGVHEDTT